ncbi:MAG: stalk domain-containing protein [Desulfocucumaceae bacterium]
MKKKNLFVVMFAALVLLVTSVPAWAVEGTLWKLPNTIDLPESGFRLEAQAKVGEQGVNVKVEATDYSKIVALDTYYVTRAVDIGMTNNLLAPVQLAKPVRMIFSFNDIDHKRASHLKTNLSVGHFRVGYWDTGNSTWAELPSQIIWNGKNGVVEADAINGGGRYALIWSYSPAQMSPVTNGKIRVMVDLRTIQSLDEPYVKDDRTMVPLRVIAENLGAKVDWIDKESRIDLLRKADKIQLWLGKSDASKNNETMPLDVAPEEVNGRTFVPLRFVAEAFGCRVDWDDLTQTAKVYSN